MSLGGPLPNVFEYLAYSKIAEEKDMILVAAAGNGGNGWVSADCWRDVDAWYPTWSLILILSVLSDSGHTPLRIQVGPAAQTIDSSSSLHNVSNHFEFKHTHTQVSSRLRPLMRIWNLLAFLRPTVTWTFLLLELMSSVPFPLPNAPFVTVWV